MRSIFFQAISKLLLGVLAVFLLIFLPAGTLSFFNGWLFLAVLFVPMLFAGFLMLFKSPDLLRRRLKAKEKEGGQSLLIKLCGLLFVAAFVVSGLARRFGWYILPRPVSLIAAAVFLLAYLLYGEVLRENEYLSRTVEVFDGQRVIDTGLYGVVRHPMYSATLLLFLSMPVILGSPVAFLLLLAYPFIIARRIKMEEAFLERELEGYSEYKKKVKYRMIPFIW